ncbi:hypothetical protein [Actinomyces sp. 217892]|uniref:hypothetical protein n=1 Tax=Actinomyces sp. 217892 TaxID=2927827 RepID=UPI002892C585|nr:hypothetical protein [Actinomyces sp. 217892]
MSAREDLPEEVPGQSGAQGGTEAPGSPGGQDIDAEFAALMAHLDLPGSADGADDAAAPGADGDDEADAQRDQEDAEEDEAPAGVSLEDVPHNTYRDPEALTVPEVEVPDDLSSLAGLAPLGPAGEAVPAPVTQPEGLPHAVKVAVVLTPVASAQALAQLCAASDLDCTVVPSGSGALAVKELVSSHAEWDVSELLAGAQTEPVEAAELAGALPRLSRAGVVLLTADLATDVGIESGLSGTITARHYAGGTAGQETSAGLVLAAADPVVEDILVGMTRAQDVRGALRTSEVRPGRTARWLGRGLRGRKGPGAQ